MYDTILVPTDGSDAAESAIDDAITIAGKFDATIHALYVVDTDSVNYAIGTEQVDRLKSGQFDEMPELAERADAAISTVVEAAKAAGVPTVKAVRAGIPHRVIRDYVKAEGIDLVVMGSHGRSGVKRALLGSVTERTLRSTRVPVLVVDERGRSGDDERGRSGDDERGRSGDDER